MGITSNMQTLIEGVVPAGLTSGDNTLAIYLLNQLKSISNEKT